MNIQQIKDKYTCIDYLGEPVKRTKHGWLYHAPWRPDIHPSLSVTPDGRGWHDLATGAHGNLIELVMTDLNTRDLKRVCEHFDSFSFSSPRVFDSEKEKVTDEGGFASFEVVPLRSRGLYAYLAKRRINITIAKQFLQEAHYSFGQRTDGRYLYALAYGNDKGGYELRSDRYKGGTSPKGITTHLSLENAPVVVFEGFFDMLSFATLCGGVRHNYIVMNSIVNKEAALEVLKSFRNQVYLALDNDDGGECATRWFMEYLSSANDIRHKFAPYKDVGDYLVSKKGRVS